MPRNVLLSNGAGFSDSFVVDVADLVSDTLGAIGKGRIKTLAEAAQVIKLYFDIIRTGAGPSIKIVQDFTSKDQAVAFLQQLELWIRGGVSFSDWGTLLMWSPKMGVDP